MSTIIARGEKNRIHDNSVIGRDLESRGVMPAGGGGAFGPENVLPDGSPQQLLRNYTRYVLLQ